MFIKTTVFKRLLKGAYKRDVLQVGHEDSTNTVSYTHLTLPTTERV